MHVVKNDNGTVEIHKNGQVFVMEQSDYELAQKFIDICNATPPRILQAAVQEMKMKEDDISKIIYALTDQFLVHRSVQQTKQARLETKLEDLKIRIFTAKDRYIDSKDRPVEYHCHACGQPLDEVARDVAVTEHVEIVIRYAKEVNHLISEYRAIESELKNLAGRSEAL